MAEDTSAVPGSAGGIAFSDDGVWEQTFDAVPDAILILDRRQRIVRANRAMAARVGTSVEALAGRRCYEVMHGRSAPPPDCPHLRMLIEGGEQRSECHEEHLNGHFLVSVSPLRDAAGAVTGSVHVARDITERLRTEESLKVDEDRAMTLVRLHELSTDRTLRELLDFALEEMVRITRSAIGYLFFYDEDSEQFHLFSWSREALRQCRMKNPPTVYRLAETGLWGEAVRQRRPVITNDYTAAGPLARGLPSGHVPLTRHMNAPIVVAGRIVAVAGVGNRGTPYGPADERQMTLLVRGVWEIVMRKQREEEILLYQSQLQTLMDKLSRLEDQERKRIADELHDTVGQNLAIAKLKLSLLRDGGGAKSAPGEFDEIAGLLDRTIQFSRSLTGELSPPLLYELGLEAAATWLAEQTQAKYGLPVGVLPCGALPPLPREVRVLLYKALRELLFNVVKHAQATQVRVRMAVEGAIFVLEVSDDGIGFDAAAARRDPVSTSGFGLFSIRERLRSWNGVLEIAAAEGRGTRVGVQVPIPGGGPGAA